MENLSRWKSHSGPAYQASKDEVLNISPSSPEGVVNWSLPPSKSHLIRLLLLAAQCDEEVCIRGINGAGEDALSMLRCLESMSVKVDSSDDTWLVKGVGKTGLQRPNTVLNCGNSGTTFRLMCATVARFDEVVMVDGDRSLRRRGSDSLTQALKQSGAEISIGIGAEELPIMISGPWQPVSLLLDISHSGQPLSALRLAACSAPSTFTIRLQGEAVSRRHIELSDRMCRQSGSTDSIDLEEGVVTLSPWQPRFEGPVDVPGDASIAAFALLFCAVHGVRVNLQNWPGASEALGHELLTVIALQAGMSWSESNEGVRIGPSANIGSVNGEVSIDLRDANDLISPIAAALALGPGGTITGATQARWKESDRLQKTVELLAQFGIDSTAKNDGISIEGAQIPAPPTGVVETHLDHRLQMTAAILASRTGGDVRGSRLHRVSHMDFLDVLKEAGVNLSESVQTI